MVKAQHYQIYLDVDYLVLDETIILKASLFFVLLFLIFIWSLIPYL